MLKVHAASFYEVACCNPLTVCLALPGRGIGIRSTAKHWLFLRTVAFRTRAVSQGQCFQADVHRSRSSAGLGGAPGGEPLACGSLRQLLAAKEKFTEQPWAAKLRDGPGLLALAAQTAPASAGSVPRELHSAPALFEALDLGMLRGSQGSRGQQAVFFPSPCRAPT